MSECEWCNRGLPLNDAGEHYRPQLLGAGKTLLCSIIARGRLEVQHEEIERLRELTANATCPCGHKGDTRESRSFCSVGHCYGCLSDQIWSQHDELIIAKREIERLKREIGEAYERAAQIADGFTCGGCGMDGKCSKAIRALKSEAQTNETGNARMGGE